MLLNSEDHACIRKLTWSYSIKYRTIIHLTLTENLNNNLV